MSENVNLQLISDMCHSDDWCPPDCLSCEQRERLRKVSKLKLKIEEKKFEIAKFEIELDLLGQYLVLLSK
jgi:hypothetical protein